MYYLSRALAFIALLAVFTFFACFTNVQWVGWTLLFIGWVMICWIIPDPTTRPKPTRRVVTQKEQ